MRGIIVSDATGGNTANDAQVALGESRTLSPDWIERLTERAFASSSGIRRLPRAHGATAGVARWVAAAARARDQQDRQAEREACWWVACHLAEADRDLACALRHAQRAIELGGDDAWRMQVSTWLERMGKHKEAATVLAPNVAQVGTAREAARLLVRMARLQARADDHQRAMQNSLEAATVWPAYADALDFAGDLAAAHGLGEAPSMLLEAADRHDQNGNGTRAFEARRRAFEAAPHSEQACHALAEALERAGRGEAADGVRCAHAKAAERSRSRMVHALRLERAVEAEATSRALTAVVDGRLEAVCDEDLGARVDAALSMAGLQEAVAARARLAAGKLRGEPRARAYIDLAGLYFGRLAAPDRAIEAWIEALAADPACGEARVALRTHARSMHDQTALAEGLIRAIRADPSDATKIECLRELATLAEERLSEPALASWAYEALAAIEGSDDALQAARGRLAPRVRLQDDALAAARKAVESGDAEARLEGFRRLAAILRGRPDSLQEYLEVVANLVRSGQGERRWWVDFERAAVRAGRLDLLEEVARERLAADIGRSDLLHYHTILVDLAWRRADGQAALREARALAEALPGTRAAHAHEWIAAAVVGDDLARAHALEHLAQASSGSVQGTFLALAGEIQAAMGQLSEATRLADLARRSDASAPRVRIFVAEQASHSPDGSFARSLEKLAAIHLPTHQYHADLVRAFEQSEDYDLALLWVRRWVDLRPWDPEILGRLLDAASRSPTSEPVVGAIMRATTSPLSFESIEPLVCRGLKDLAERDLDKAVQLARELCDLYGARRAGFRQVLLDIAGRASDHRFEVRVMERWLASREAPCDSEAWLRLSDRYREIDELEAAATALTMAARQGADPSSIFARAEVFGDTGSGDAALAVIEATALAHQAVDAGDDAASAWLALGSARWERADDRVGAVEAWVHGLGGPDARGFARLAESLSDFANGEIAAAAIRDFARRCDNPAMRASALVVAAARALALSQTRLALDLALEALREDSRRTDALVVVERASERAGTSEVFDEAHDLAASGAKGRFGRRAAHLRAARTLEQRNHPELAIVHAIAAFEADPVQGSALVAMLRLAEKVEPSAVIESLAETAERTDHREQRAYWWMQAAHLAAGRAEHAGRALDLALRALHAAPSVDAVELMSEVIRSIPGGDTEDADIFELRIERARKALAPKLEGPVGARIALAAASLGASVMNNATMAMAWAQVALSCSGDIDEYTTLMESAPVLAEDTEGSKSFVDEVLTRSEGLRGTTGEALFAFSKALAAFLGDTVRQDKLHQAERHRAEREASRDADPFADFADLADDLSADSDHPPDHEEPVPEADPSPPPEASQSKQTLPPGAWPAGTTSAETLASSDTQERPPDTERGLGRGSAPPDLLEEAAQRESRGQIAEAIELIEGMEPSDELRPRVDAMLRRLYEASGRNSKLTVVLERIAERAQDPQEKIRALVEMAGLRKARGDREGARATWQLVTEVDPGHPDAWTFLESDARERGDFGVLAQLLLKRSTIATSLDEVRALRLERARLLDRELGLTEQAQQELDELATELGADGSVLSYRGELAERTSGEQAAAGYFARAASLVRSRTEAVALAARAASAYMRAGRTQQAREVLSVVGEIRDEALLALRIEVGRQEGSALELADDLADWADLASADARTRGMALLEAADIAWEHEDAERAVQRARDASKLVPNDVSLQLRAALLIYRAEGLTKREHVVEMLDRLQACASDTAQEQRGLHAFLTAECVEVIEGTEASLELLRERKRSWGPQPLVALGLADRLAASGDPHASLPLFDIALAADDLLGLRTRAQVAFSAAHAALREGGSAAAAPYVAMVEREPGAEAMVERLRMEMAEMIPATDEMRRQLDSLARTTKGTERAKALWKLAQLSAARGTRASNAEAEGYYVEAIAAASGDERLRDDISAERDAFRSRLTPSKLPPPATADRASVPPPPKAPTFGNEPSTLSGSPPPMPLSALPSTPPTRRSTSSAPPKRPEAHEPPLSSTISSQPPPPRSPIDPEAERKLLEALAAGDVDAGDQIASMLAGDPERTQDVVAIRRRQVVLLPHRVRHLELLRDATSTDRNPAHAAAVHHVICVLTGQQPPPPPSLQSQTVDPDRLMVMIGRGVHGHAAEVLGAIWTHASHLFARDPSSYGLSGLERVALSAPSPVGRAYATASRALGLGKTPVFQRRSTGPLNLAVAVLSPPSVVVTGDVEDGPELVYRMAAMLAGTTRDNGMLFGLPANAVRQLMLALEAAFGPPDVARKRVSESAVLAAELWRALPGSVQRRFRELFAKGAAFTYEGAWARALQSSRRAGLYVVGNLAVALEDVSKDPGVQDGVDFGATDAYRSLTRVSPSAADLVRFASSVEFAEVRWRESRRSSSTGTLQARP